MLKKNPHLHTVGILRLLLLLFFEQLCHVSVVADDTRKNENG